MYPGVFNHANRYTKLCAQISQWYKVVIFTASMSEYADPVIDWLDQDQTFISQRYFRQVKTGCDNTQTKYLVYSHDSSLVCSEMETF